MTARVCLEVRRAEAPPAREELRRQLLALVLALVLVWYTFVVPAHAAADGSRSYAPDDEGHDGEVRGAGPPPAGKAGPQAVEDLDWPEFIYP